MGPKWVLYLKNTPKNQLMSAVFYAGESRRPNIAYFKPSIWTYFHVKKIGVRNGPV